MTYEKRHTGKNTIPIADSDFPKYPTNWLLLPEPWNMAWSDCLPIEFGRGTDQDIHCLQASCMEDQKCTSRCYIPISTDKQRQYCSFDVHRDDGRSFCWVRNGEALRISLSSFPYGGTSEETAAGFYSGDGWIAPSDLRDISLRYSAR